MATTVASTQVLRSVVATKVFPLDALDATLLRPAHLIALL
jgi:hypothetical protein